MSPANDPTTTMTSFQDQLLHNDCNGVVIGTAAVCKNSADVWANAQPTILNCFMLPLGFAAKLGLGFSDGTVIFSISTLLAFSLAEGLGSKASWPVIRPTIKPEHKNQQIISKLSKSIVIDIREVLATTETIPYSIQNFDHFLFINKSCVLEQQMLIYLLHLVHSCYFWSMQCMHCATYMVSIVLDKNDILYNIIFFIKWCSLIQVWQSKRKL